MITVQQFQQAVPCSFLTASTWHPHIQKAMIDWQIVTPLRIAGFIAQMAHESGKFARFEEGLNYSAIGLANTWPKRYSAGKGADGKHIPNELARRLHRNPQAIANTTYANRMGNGDIASGDGWKFRGRGPKQITGADNYRACGEALTLDLINYPDLLLTPRHGAQAAGWFWHTHGCNPRMDAGDFLGCTIAINGGTLGHEDGNTTGLDDRVELFVHAKRVFEIA